MTGGMPFLSQLAVEIRVSDCVIQCPLNQCTEKESGRRAKLIIINLGNFFRDQAELSV